MLLFIVCSPRRINSISLLIPLALAALGCSRQHEVGLKDADATFVERAASGGMAEIRLGQLAQERGESVAVKNFAAQMVADNTDANNKLQIVARQTQLPLPPEMSPEERSLYSTLSNLKGAAFDQAYADAMVNDHEADVSDFEKEANEGKVKQIREFAMDALPVLKEHLEKAHQLQKSILSATIV
jgi:putative membrane protein